MKPLRRRLHSFNFYYRIYFRFTSSWKKNYSLMQIENSNLFRMKLEETWRIVLILKSAVPVK